MASGTRPAARAAERKDADLFPICFLELIIRSALRSNFPFKVEQHEVCFLSERFLSEVIYRSSCECACALHPTRAAVVGWGVLVELLINADPGAAPAHGSKYSNTPRLSKHRCDRSPTASGYFAFATFCPIRSLGCLKGAGVLMVRSSELRSCPPDLCSLLPVSSRHEPVPAFFQATLHKGVSPCHNLSVSSTSRCLSPLFCPFEPVTGEQGCTFPRGLPAPQASCFPFHEPRSLHAAVHINTGW